MAKTATPRITEPNLPWVDHSEDRGFRWLMIIIVVLFLGAGIILNQIELPEIVQKNLVDVSPRLAKLITEKQKVKPPEPKKIIPEKKKVEKKKEKPKKKEKKKEKPKKKKVEKKSAREVAENTGLIALSDELNDLRESFELDDVLKLPQTNTGKEEVKVASASASDLLSASAGQSSGGIQVDTLNRKITTSELAQRKTTKVESKIESNQQIAAAAAAKKAKQASGSGGSSAGIRSADEIERVFQRNKGGIFNLYNRALRKNPSLAGQVVVELTISPSGQVTAARILSSELGDEKLERKLVLKIKKFKFAKANVAKITVTYPIEFLPS